MNSHELAKRLGCHRTTIFPMVRLGILPPLRRGKPVDTSRPFLKTRIIGWYESDILDLYRRIDECDPELARLRRRSRTLKRLFEERRKVTRPRRDG